MKQRFGSVYKVFAAIATAIFFLISACILGGCEDENGHSYAWRESYHYCYQHTIANVNVPIQEVDTRCKAYANESLK